MRAIFKYCTWKWILVIAILAMFCWNNVVVVHPMISQSVQNKDNGFATAGGVDTFVNNDLYDENLSFRFPSREERLRYYMGDWYDASTFATTWNRSSFCQDIPYFNVTKWPKSSDKAFLFDINNVQDYAFSHYTRDMKKFLFRQQSTKQDASASVANTTTLLRLAMAAGDQHPSLQHPVILKSRELPGYRKQANNDDKIPIIALFNEIRHFSKVTQYQRLRLIQRPWKLKQSKLIWRGAATGYGNAVKRKKLIDQFYNGTATTTAASSIHNLVDIAFEPKLTVSQLLQYKYLLSLEGNDVASGLKWMLYSNSVVFMPPPTHVSWAMEDQLVPYYHYIPVHANLSDLISKVQWAQQNEAICRQIAKHATEYMQQLYTSRQAKEDTIWIHQQIVQRYQQQFGTVASQCPMN